LKPGNISASGGSLSAIFGIVFLDLLGFGILIPQLGIYGVKFHATPFEVGLLASSYSLMQLVAAPWLGRLSDRHGRRPVLLFSLIGSAAGFVLFAFAHSLPLLFLSRIIDGASGGNISTAQAYIADVTTPENRAKGMGLIGAAFGLGFVLGPAIGGFLGAAGGNLAIGLFAASLAVLNVVMVALFLPESRHPGSAPARTPLFSRTTFQQKEVAVLVVMFGLFTLGFSEMEGTFSVFLMTEHLGFRDLVSSFGDFLRGGGDPRYRAVSLKAGYVFAVVGVVSAAIQGGLLGRLKQRFGEQRLVLAGCVLTALGLAGLPLAPSYGWVFLPSAVLAAGSALNNPSLSSLVSQRSPPDRQGEVLGTYQAMGAIARVLGPALGGWLFTVASPAAPFVSGAVLAVLCAGLALRLQRPGNSGGPASSSA
jgi:MFS transporter, DHA1 family, tetracycline resistance protein